MNRIFISIHLFSSSRFKGGMKTGEVYSVWALY